MLCCSMDFASFWARHKHLLVQATASGLGSPPVLRRADPRWRSGCLLSCGLVAGCLGTWSSSTAPPHSPLPPATPLHGSGTETTPLMGRSSELLVRVLPGPFLHGCVGPGQCPVQVPWGSRGGCCTELSLRHRLPEQPAGPWSAQGLKGQKTLWRPPRGTLTGYFPGRPCLS